jgi:SRSO17 transposase
VLADAGYGNDTDFRDAITELGLPYVVGITSATSLWRNRCETPTACAVIYRAASAARCGIQYSLMVGMTSGMSW